ncbi:MAG: hypothetical protein J2O48_09845 [Solirubrobacterales bacterium]|nr:hypothetical protein [Solirubrobacterales bacterium]
MTCPICSAPAVQTARYPLALCSDCKAQATSLDGQPVELLNDSVSGGFVAEHRGDRSVSEQVTRDGLVLVRGTLCRAEEARFGGIVVQPAGSGQRAL